MDLLKVVIGKSLKKGKLFFNIKTLKRRIFGVNSDKFRSIFGVNSDKFRSIFSVRILNTACLIYNNPHISAQEIANEISVTKRTAENYLAKLKSANYIVRVGSDKTGYWKIVKKG